MQESHRSQPQQAKRAADDAASVEVYAVHGAEPEVQAYAMAKYSRSALSMKESLAEINAQKAETFLNTFYFQYGHRSIADLAHLAIAIEKLSILAAVAVVDEPRWDGQERSTRYQDFSRPNYSTPDFGGLRDVEARYRQTIESLFAAYRELSAAAFRHLCERVAKPPDMAREAYERTLRARAFDVARYLLPLATNTSLGQIVNARTLETQVARLLSHTHGEVRRIGQLLKEAAKRPAYNPNEARLRELWEEINAREAEWGRRSYDLLCKEVRVAPTLVKYAEPSNYEIETRRELSAAAAEVMSGAPIEASPPVDLLEDEPLEIEVATTLLYEHCHYPYRQIRECVEGLPGTRRQEIVVLGRKHRGAHDELLRALCAGQKFRFDILMDIGGFRDLHRHRRCIQVGQAFTTAHGFDTPDEVRSADVGQVYDETMRRAGEASAGIAAQLRTAGRAELAAGAEYAIPLGYRKRTLFKMDFAEVVYIAELRTAPAGHMSYRRIAYQMYQAVAQRYPGLAGYFRVHDPAEATDLLRR